MLNLGRGRKEETITVAQSGGANEHRGCTTWAVCDPGSGFEFRFSSHTSVLNTP